MEGLTAWVRSHGVFASYVAGMWEIGSLRASALLVGGQQVVGARAAAVPDPAGGATVDVEARQAIDAILSALRQHGLIAPG